MEGLELVRSVDPPSTIGSPCTFRSVRFVRPVSAASNVFHGHFLDITRPMMESFTPSSTLHLRANVVAKLLCDKDIFQGGTHKHGRQKSRKRLETKV